MAPVIFTEKAGAELIEAQDWYEAELPGLGRQFRDEVDLVVSQTSATPLLFPVVHRNVRRALLRRFPYALMFVMEDDERLTVIACFHGSRNPTQWKKRS